MAKRCKRRVGWKYNGVLGHATHTLLSACLNRKVDRDRLRGRRLSMRSREPRVGDLVLFHNTRDSDGDGAKDDRFTLAGLVVAVEAGAVSFVHIRRNRARLGRLHLGQPNRRRLSRGGKVLNSYLRTIRPGDAPDTAYLAGQLLAGFATL